MSERVIAQVGGFDPNKVEQFYVQERSGIPTVSHDGPFEVLTEGRDGRTYIVARFWEAGRALFKHTPDGRLALAMWTPKHTPVQWSGCCEGPPKSERLA